MRQMQADSSSLFLGMILFWFLSFQYYKRYGKKTAKNLTFLCKVAPIDGTVLKINTHKINKHCDYSMRMEHQVWIELELRNERQAIDIGFPSIFRKKFI